MIATIIRPRACANDVKNFCKGRQCGESAHPSQSQHLSRRAAAVSTPGAMAPPIDRQRALQNFGTPQIMDKLLVKFPETVNPTMEWLRSAVEQGNVRDMKVQIRSHGPRARASRPPCSSAYSCTCAHRLRRWQYTSSKAPRHGCALTVSSLLPGRYRMPYQRNPSR